MSIMLSKSQTSQLIQSDSWLFLTMVCCAMASKVKSTLRLSAVNLRKLKFKSLTTRKKLLLSVSLAVLKTSQSLLTATSSLSFLAVKSLWLQKNIRQQNKSLIHQKLKHIQLSLLTERVSSMCQSATVISAFTKQRWLAKKISTSHMLH